MIQGKRLLAFLMSPQWIPEESFLIISGKSELEVEGQSTVLERGDVVYIPRFWTHQMKNPFEETLVFADIYWDWKGRTKEEYLEAVNG